MKDPRQNKVMFNGQEIIHEGKKYIIGEPIGFGGTCVVYEGVREDSETEGRLTVTVKEFFPLTIAKYIERKDGSLVLRDDIRVENLYGVEVKLREEFEEGLKGFREAYEIQKELYGNSTMLPLDYFREGDWAYCVIEAREGASLDKNRNGLSSLYDIAELTISLAEAIKPYHEKGFLHLDIKPSNIFRFEKENRIALFDFDSVRKLDDIKGGKVTYLPYSQGWAPPEELAGRIEDIGPASDIFSIGAVLFWLIFDGRKPNGDDVRNISDGKFDAFDWNSTHVQIEDRKRKIIEDIFSRTLNTDCDKRYQNVKALINATEKLKPSVLDAVTSLVSMSKVTLCVSGIVFLLAVVGFYTVLKGTDKVLQKLQEPSPIELTNQKLREDLMGVYKSRAFETLGQPYTEAYDTDNKIVITLHKLQGVLVYLFFEEGKNITMGIAVQSRESGLEISIPETGIFTLGKDTYADFSKNANELLPQLFSYKSTDVTSNDHYDNTRNYTEYFESVGNNVVILSDNNRIGPFDKNFDVLNQQRASELYPGNEDYGIYGREIYSESAYPVYEIGASWNYFQSKGGFFVKNGRGHVCVVDRLNSDERLRYEKYRENSRPSIIGIFPSDNRELATKIFAAGNGIIPNYETYRSFWPQSWPLYTPTEELFKFCTTGNLQQIKEVIKSGADVNARDQYGLTVLMRTVFMANFHNALQTVATLLEAGADVNARDRNGTTVLAHASYGHSTTFEVVTTLLAAGADAKGEAGGRALLSASQNPYQDPNVLVALLEAGADVNVLNGSPLIQAAFGNSPGAVTILLEAGADINARDDDGNTVLTHWATGYQNPEILSALLAAGADVNARNKKGYIALMEVVADSDNERNTLETVSTLLEAGSDINAHDEDGNTVLMLATKGSDLKMITTLLRAGADVNVRNKKGYTALMEAVNNKSNAGVISALLKAGSDVNAQSEEGHTVLMLAAYGSDLRVIITLLEAGADVNARDKNGYTALMSAVLQNQDPKALSALLKAGSDINAQSGEGHTVLMLAAYGSDARMITTLLEAGADVNARGKSGATALTLAAIRQKQDPSVLITLLEAGADINARNLDGSTALILAVRNNNNWRVANDGTAYNLTDSVNEKNSEVISTLIGAGADVNARDNTGATALMWTAMRQNLAPNALITLLKAGADVNARNKKGDTALMWASYNKNLGIISALLEAEADINAQDVDGNTALMKGVSQNQDPKVISALLKAGLLQAVIDKNAEVISTLLQAGADVHIRNKAGQTALMWATRDFGNPEAISLLLEAGADANDRDESGKRALDYAKENERLNNTDAYRQLESLSN